MNSIFLTGGSGFVGTNLQSYLSQGYQFKNFRRGEQLDVKEDIVLHLAGKAHDTKNITNPNEYYQVNTELTKQVFDTFLQSTAKVFITLSSVKAAADKVDGILTEEIVPNPQTHYGKSKLLAEQYILSKPIPPGKRVYIIRPCMIHGPGNKGNLNLLYDLVNKSSPRVHPSFDNQRSFCSIENLLFVIKLIIEKNTVPSGIYNVSDDETLSTNDIIRLIAQIETKKVGNLSLPGILLKLLAYIGDYLNLPLNSERLKKLTESYKVNNGKIINAIDEKLPIRAEEGLIKTLRAFSLKREQ